MRLFSALLPLAAVSLFGACSSSVEEALDGTLRRRIETIENCFPGMIDVAGEVFSISDSWSFRSGVIPDPLELSWSQAPNGGPITVEYDAFDFTIEMTITFHGPNGATVAIDVSASNSLSAAISTAATELRNQFADQLKFIMGDWEIVSPPADLITGEGTITGVIGGTANQNELEALFITTNNTSAGQPPNADSAVRHTGTGCSMTYGSPTGIMTDTVPNQQFPIGTLTFRLVGSETVTGSVVFTNGQFATISVSNIPGNFSWDLESGDISYNG